MLRTILPLTPLVSFFSYTLPMPFPPIASPLCFFAASLKSPTLNLLPVCSEREGNITCFAPSASEVCFTSSVIFVRGTRLSSVATLATGSAPPWSNPSKEGADGWASTTTKLLLATRVAAQAEASRLGTPLAAGASALLPSGTNAWAADDRRRTTRALLWCIFLSVQQGFEPCAFSSP